jgi:hypothetical protein
MEIKMTSSYQNSETLFVIENPEMEALANELVQLTPDFNTANTDTKRSLEILQAFDSATLSSFEKREIIGYVRYHWGAATTAAVLTDGRKLVLSQLMLTKTAELCVPKPELVA